MLWKTRRLGLHGERPTAVSVNTRSTARPPLTDSRSDDVLPTPEQTKSQTPLRYLVRTSFEPAAPNQLA